MPLPHFTNIESHTSQDEPIFKNLYEVTVVLPSLLNFHSNARTILLENIISIGLPAYKDLGEQVQKFKYSTRKFLGIPTETSVDFSMTLNMNQNKDFQISTWRIMKDWYDLGWNNEDGTLHYKRNVTGEVVIHLHDREGHVVRRITYYNCQLKNISGFDVDVAWGESDIFDLKADFIADFWEDYYY
jgi:hypothetical protein